MRPRRLGERALGVLHELNQSLVMKPGSTMSSKNLRTGAGGNVADNQLRILVVDYSTRLWRLLRLVLGRAGHVVHAVGSAEDARRRPERSEYDLVISDRSVESPSSDLVLRKPFSAAELREAVARVMHA